MVRSSGLGGHSSKCLVSYSQRVKQEPAVGHEGAWLGLVGVKEEVK